MAPPSSVEAYLQESGRASRDGLGANAWLVFTPEDALDSGDLRRDSPGQPGYARSEEAGLEGDSGKQRASGTAVASPTPTATSASDAEAIAQARRAAMIRYAASTDRCRREMLLEALGIEAQAAMSAGGMHGL